MLNKYYHLFMLLRDENQVAYVLSAVHCQLLATKIKELLEWHDGQKGDFSGHHTCQHHTAAGDDKTLHAKEAACPPKASGFEFWMKCAAHAKGMKIRNTFSPKKEYFEVNFAKNSSLRGKMCF